MEESTVPSASCDWAFDLKPILTFTWPGFAENEVQWFRNNFAQTQMNEALSENYGQMWCSLLLLCLHMLNAHDVSLARV